MIYGLLILTILILITVLAYSRVKRILAFGKRLFIKCRIQLSKGLESLSIWIQKISRAIFVYEDKSKNVIFGDLTPSSDIPDLVYDVRIEWALRNRNVKNLALTGPYGSGKSSVLKTFQKKHLEFQYLNISLASFKEPYSENDKAPTPKMEGADDKGDKASNKQTTLADLIELSILQQIFYFVKHKHIPGSRFKRIKKQSKTGLGFKSLGIILCLCSVALIWKKDFILKLLGAEKFYKDHSPFALYLEVFFIISGLFILFYTILKIYSNSKLHKLSLSSGEVEIASDIDSSILNKHLDEILYFFEATRYNVVIFEDLDRFETPEIFTKLREINILINNSLQIKRKITFIYALKDEIFKNEKRTKFFDYLIPVVPVITSVNSGEMLVQKLESMDLLKDLSKNFLADISLYIDDMRLLINVLNEFLLYKELFKQVSISCEKLFAIVLYKNTDPGDFALLQNNRGVVADFIREKQTYLDFASLEAKNKLAKVEETIKKLEKSVPQDIRQLRYIYLGTLIGMLPDTFNGRLSIGQNSNYTIAECLSDQIFGNLKVQNNIQFYGRQNGYGHPNLMNSNHSFKTIEDSVDASSSYQDRENILKDKNAHDLESLRQEKEKLLNEINKCKSYTIRDLCSMGIPRDFDVRLKGNSLLSYLIRYGYIDEQFPYYTAHFYEGTFSKEDLDFLLNVKSNKSLPFDAPLNQVENLLSRLQPAEFGQPVLLNFALLDFLLTDGTKYKDQLQNIKTQFIEESKIAISFLDQYIQHGMFVGAFFWYLPISWDKLWNFIENRSGFSNQRKNVYLLLILEYCSIDQIDAIDKKSGFAGYLCEKEDALTFLKDIDLVKMKEVIKGLKMKFSNLTNTGENKELLEFIYQGSYYAINQEMITMMIKAFGKQENPPLSGINYQHILNADCEELNQYLNANYEQFIVKVFILNEVYRNEPDSSLVIILNSTLLSDETKAIIIEKSLTILSDITLVTGEIWSLLLAKKKIKVDWFNLFNYKLHFGIDEAFISYLNDKEIYTVLSKEQLIVDEKSADLLGFFQEIYELKSLDDSVVCSLVINVKVSFAVLDFTHMSKFRINGLVENEIIALSKENFRNLVARGDGMNIVLIRKHWQLFINNIQDYSLSISEILSFLQDRSISTEDKKILLNTIDTTQIDSASADSLLTVIPIIGVKVSQPMAIALVRKSSDANLGARLISDSLEVIGRDEVEELVTVMGEPYSSIFDDEETIPLEDSKENAHLLDQLIAWGFISKYSKEGDLLVVEPQT